MKKINLVSIYNDKKVLNKCLKSNLKPFDNTIFIDNTTNKFKSYNESFQYIKNKIKDDEILVITHQDIIFLDKLVKEKIKSFVLDKKYYLAGVVGVKKFKTNIKEGGVNNIFSKGKRIGFKEINKPVEIETMDGCVIITNKATIDKCNLFSDEKLGWHFYDVDSCLSVKKQNIKIHCLPIILNHDFNINKNKTNPIYYSLIPYILKKHKTKTIYTVCGKWNMKRYHYIRCKNFINPLLNLFD